MSASRHVHIRPATEADLPQILALLERSDLPPDGVSDHLNTVFVAELDGSIMASGALELYGPFALLRSVAVDATCRGEGLGLRMTREMLDFARRKDVSNVYLLTETASEFFPKLGFRILDRSLVPSPVKQSIEFTSACPESALAMALELNRSDDE